MFTTDKNVHYMLLLLGRSPHCPVWARTAAPASTSYLTAATYRTVSGRCQLLYKVDPRVVHLCLTESHLQLVSIQLNSCSCSQVLPSVACHISSCHI